MTRLALRSCLLALASTILLAGCSSGAQGPSSGFAASGNCKATKAEMNQLVSQGVEGEIAAQQAGRQLSPAAQARVERYNGLLDSYLGSQCYV